MDFDDTAWELEKSYSLIYEIQQLLPDSVLVGSFTDHVFLESSAFLKDLDLSSTCTNIDDVLRDQRFDLTLKHSLTFSSEMYQGTFLLKKIDIFIDTCPSIEKNIGGFNLRIETAASRLSKLKYIVESRPKGPQWMRQWMREKKRIAREKIKKYKNLSF